MLNFLFDLTLTLWDFVCVTMLVKIYAEKRFYKYKEIIYCIYGVSFLLCMILRYYAQINLYIAVLGTITIMIIHMCVVFDIKLIKVLSLLIVYGVINWGIYWMSRMILSYEILFLRDGHIKIQGLELLIMLLSKILVFIVSSIPKYYREWKTSREAVFTRNKDELGLSIISTIVITWLMLKYGLLRLYINDIYIIYFAIVVMLTNVLFVFSMRKTINREMVLQTQKFNKEIMLYKANFYSNESTNLEKQKRMIHEFKNHIECINELIRKKDFVKLGQYCGNINEVLFQYSEIIDTNNPIINAILNSKYKIAHDKKVVLVLKVNNLKDVNLSDVDLVTILSNLFNNAIEAAEKSEEKIVKAKIVYENKQMIISIKNSIVDKVVFNKTGIPVSTKKDKDYHGIGIKNIIEVVNRNGGEYFIDCVDNEFVFTIII